MSLKTKIAAGGLTLASAGLLAMIVQWESRENTAYADKLAGGVPTVCAGITPATSPYPVIVGDYWDDATCERVEKLVVAKAQLRLADCIYNDQVTQNVFDALSDMAHNVGVANVCASRAVGLINAGDIEAGCKAIAHAPSGKPVWSYVTSDGRKVFVRGLYNRRVAEMEICLSGVSK